MLRKTNKLVAQECKYSAADDKESLSYRKGIQMHPLLTSHCRQTFHLLVVRNIMYVINLSFLLMIPRINTTTLLGPCLHGQIKA